MGSFCQFDLSLGIRCTPVVLTGMLFLCRSVTIALRTCRFNLAAGFAEKAKDQGELGLAAVFVWLRYCQTRQLNWNVNYNVKPR
jgi:hypothetical protein